MTLFRDLTHPAEPLARSEHLLVGARSAGHPIPNTGTPGDRCTTEILDDVDGARALGGTAYVDCRGGGGLTGTVIGCRLGRHGLDRGDAVAVPAGLRRAVAGERPSPETPGQVALVRGWRHGT